MRITEQQRASRHPLPVRLAHWINVVAFTALLSSGLVIFNAHPALYWGDSSYGTNPAWLEISARQGSDGAWAGITRIYNLELRTTGVLGLSDDVRGMPEARGFPWWVTTPNGLWLAMSRSWHFFFAWMLVLNGVFFVGYSAASGHLRQDLFRWPPIVTNERAGVRYTLPQRMAYLSVIFIVVPGCIATGLAMSPWLDAVIPGFVGVLGGHQSARSLHFIGAFVVVAFVGIHLAALVLDQPWNRLRSMITGRFDVGQRRNDG